MNNTFIKQLDPMKGLEDYINDIKPYHTKIIEKEVEYTKGEMVVSTITEEILIEFS